ncbi:proline dehydrogenase 1, mitochondrial-like [Xyrauchen texanus]|uniref:proline dehydrogenase 1, mitochondrial-like n=1 Tax=Xyrauchen texanus TaxID=154827 RepID=UPI002242668B|nr:proline dehydrogenase 1, mitochondrial-like [Xyrauchen texanus]
MSLLKTLPAFALATRGSNIRGLFCSTRHGYHRSVQAPTKTNAHEDPSHNDKISIDFEQTKEAYKSKDTLELLRSLVVFKLFSYDILVEKNKEIIDLSRKFLGQKMFEQVMKMTIYGQFVAGEDHQSIKPMVQKNQAYGVGAVLDYSVEEDLSQEEAERKEMAGRKFTAHHKFDDRREGAMSARTYFYADEAKCDQHMETFLNCIKASGGSSEDGFSAIKMTALGRPQFLLQLSEVLVKWRRFFSFLAAKQGKDGVEVLEQKLDLVQLQACLARLGAQGNILSWFSDGHSHSSGSVDMLDWNSLIDERTKIFDLLVVPNLQTGQLEPLLCKFTEEEEKQMKRMIQRLDILAKYAVENGVRLMVDAEQTYFQPAINRLTVEMQRIFNRDKSVIFNTYQCYLKEAFDNVSMDVELSRREGWFFGAKLVRGAYMYQERSRAADIGYEDPINPDYETTNIMYHRCLDYVLEEIERNKRANVMVASHNLDTVKHTLRRMNEMGLAPTDKKVYFGQLLGMCDQISFPLAQAGFPVYKYVPFGPVNEVIPYLSRRAQENRGIMKGTQMERDLLWKELMRRLTSGEVFYTPAL